jgi:hypothetical protein
LIGINYFNTPNQLKGCINDVHNMNQFLTSRYHFNPDDMVILTDDSNNPRAVPTRANILRAMDWLVSGAHPNDNLFFHYSGHGGQTEDLDGDEEDGYDETIYPLDFKQAGMIIDDEMHDRMVKPLPPGCRFTAVFDCCHSGSALDLPYEYVSPPSWFLALTLGQGVQGTLKEPNLLAEAGQGLLGAGLSYLRGDMSGVISAGQQLFKKVTTGKSAREKAITTKTSPADVIMFSGCKDNQTSADAVEAVQPPISFVTLWCWVRGG